MRQTRFITAPEKGLCVDESEPFATEGEIMETKSEMPRRNLKWFGAALLLVAAFMFVSIIVKTALQGP